MNDVDHRRVELGAGVPRQLLHRFDHGRELGDTARLPIALEQPDLQHQRLAGLRPEHRLPRPLRAA
jgi:hypothetical protein